LTVADFEGLFAKYKAEDVASLRGDLTNSAIAYKDELQKIVFNNYEKFIESSRDIEGTEKEVEELGVLLQDIKRNIREMSKLDLHMDKDDIMRPIKTLIPPNDYISTLDVALIKQDLDEAVRLCEKAGGDQLGRQSFIARERLVRSLILNCMYGNHPEEKEKEYIDLMTRLESREVARDIYLDGKSSVIKSRIK
jgi:hypothetical protein